MTTRTSIDAHIRDNGVTPSVRIVHWGDRLTLQLTVGDSEMTWYMTPLTDEPVEDYIVRVIDALSDVSVATPLPSGKLKYV